MVVVSSDLSYSAPNFGHGCGRINFGYVLFDGIFGGSSAGVPCDGLTAIPLDAVCFQARSLVSPNCLLGGLVSVVTLLVPPGNP